jgi:hypothetical protein
MESLAIFVGYMLLVMLVFVLAVIVLSILVFLKKIPKVVGYVAVGLQTILTVFAFQLTQMLGYTSLSILLICGVLVFFDSIKKRY